MKKIKGEVKVSVKGNPFSQNDTQWNFGVYKTENMKVDLGLQQLLDLLKNLGKDDDSGNKG